MATTAGQLPARWVVHSFGPVWSAQEDRSHLLASCYRSALLAAAELGAVSVAFPAISTGVYGWPMDDGTQVAVRTVREVLAASESEGQTGHSSRSFSVAEVRFVLCDEPAQAELACALGWPST